MENYNIISVESSKALGKLVNNELDSKTYRFLLKVTGQVTIVLNNHIKYGNQNTNYDIDREFVDIFLNVKDGKLGIKTAGDQLKSLMDRVLIKR